MADNPEVIRRQMDETKASLAEKLEALESQVTSTVQSATEAVAETVETVKGTVENVTEAVQETVHTVGETFNLKLQFERHPWPMLGGSVAVGCLVGYLTGGNGRSNGRGWGYGGSEENADHMTSRMSSASPEEYRHEPEPRWSSQPEPASQTASRPEEPAQKGWLWEELGRLKNLGLGALMAAVRDLTVRSLPGQLGEKVAEEVDHLTTKLGAEPIHGSIFPQGK
jgi:ElaB/YqjD/DUF883 family membrane-anchored ribosome-binding protein